MELIGAHPLDVIEDILHSDKVETDRLSQDELSLKVVGDWSRHHCRIEWHEESSYLMIGCELDLSVLPGSDEIEIAQLLMLVNPMLIMGHFEYQVNESAIVLRHVLSLRGTMGVVPEQIADIIENLIQIADYYYPSFDMLINHQATAEAAYQVASFEVQGRA